MSDSNSNEELNAKTICCDCVSESFLTVEIKTKGEKTACSYCGQSTECISILDMTNRVEKAFEQHYSRTCEPDETDIMLGNDRKGKPVVEAIAEAVGLSYEVEQAATDINTILYRRHYNEKDAKKGWEQEFDTNSYYERNELEAPQWVEAWNAFTDSFKYNNRFFNQSSSKLLKSIFKDVDKIETKSGQSLIIEAGPDTKYPEIYRARVFQSIQKLEKAITYPDKELGPPPSGIASAGRMNAQGISVFYGATKPKVALAEIRPPVGSQVAIARFEIIKKLNLLDLTALETVSIKGSIFDPEYTKRVEREVFLKTLGQKMTKPVMPNDETLEYLPTQAIADFLASKSTPHMDGIIFPSAQTNSSGLNLVLFHKASQVEMIEVSDEENFSVQEDWEPNSETHSYHIIEDQPEHHRPTGTVFEINKGKKTSSPPLDLKYTLRIDLQKIEVCHIKAVKFESNDSAVIRYRSSSQNVYRK